MAEQRECDLNEFVAGAGLVEQRVGQQEQEAKISRHSQCDIDRALVGEPYNPSLSQRTHPLRGADAGQHVADADFGQKNGSDYHQWQAE